MTNYNYIFIYMCSNLWPKATFTDMDHRVPPQQYGRQPAGRQPAQLAGKRSSEEVKSWYEYWFDHGSYKFRRMHNWDPEVAADFVPPVAEEDNNMQVN